MCRGATTIIKPIIYNIKEKRLNEIFSDDELDEMNDIEFLKTRVAALHENNKKLKDRMTNLIKGEKEVIESYEKKLASKDMDIVRNNVFND
jgi:hypothetical protein